MPIMELYGREYAIPFDAEGIANLLYRGIKVYPDEKTDGKQLAVEQETINGHLGKLWKDEKMRTVPSGLETKPGIENPPAAEGERKTFNDGDMLQFQGGKKFTAMKTMPTPKTNFNLREIAVDRFKKPMSTDM
jgi:hypothetical protein